jgi:hypothetical protein
LPIADQLSAQPPDLKLDRGVLIAGTLCHDVGKPWEFDPRDCEPWEDRRSIRLEQPGASVSGGFTRAGLPVGRQDRAPCTTTPWFWGRPCFRDGAALAEAPRPRVHQ